LATLRLIQLADLEEDAGQNLLIHFRLAGGGTQATCFHCSPARGVDERAILLREARAGKAVHRSPDGLSSLRRDARGSPEIAGFVGIDLANTSHSAFLTHSIFFCVFGPIMTPFMRSLEQTIPTNSDFWRSPGITPEEMKTIRTTVYRLPCAGFAEKDGTFVNSARWLQWKHVAVRRRARRKWIRRFWPASSSRSASCIKRRVAIPRSYPERGLGLHGPEQPVSREVAKEINGRALADITDVKLGQTIKPAATAGLRLAARRRFHTMRKLLYSGSWTEAGAMIQRRVRRIHPVSESIRTGPGRGRPIACVLYNRASCDVSGKPWDPTAGRSGGTKAQQRWLGVDVPDFKVDSPPKITWVLHHERRRGGPDLRPLAHSPTDPFLSFTSPSRAPSRTRCIRSSPNNPVVKKYSTAADKYGTPEKGSTSSCTTYRLTEHYHYWTKNNPIT